MDFKELNIHLTIKITIGWWWGKPFFRRFLGFLKKSISCIKIKMAPAERKMNFTLDMV